MLSNFIDAPLGAFSPCSYCRIVDALMSRNAANAAWLAFVCVRIILICPSVYFLLQAGRVRRIPAWSGLRDQSFPVRPVLGQGSSLVNQRGLSLAGKLFAALNPSGPHSVRYSAALRSCGSLILGVRRQSAAARHKKRATPSGWPFLFATCCLVEPAGIEPASVSNPSADLHA